MIAKPVTDLELSVHEPYEKDKDENADNDFTIETRRKSLV